MTLLELTKVYCKTGKLPSTIYIFDCEEYFDSFVNGKEEYEVLFCVSSDFVCGLYLKPEYAKANVECFSAINKDLLAAWITPLDKETTNE